MSDPSAPGNPYGEPVDPQGQPAQEPTYGQQPPTYGQQPPQYGQPGYYSAPMLPGPDPDKRPGTVTAACVLTLVLSGLTAVFTLIGIIALLAEKDEILDNVRTEEGLEDLSPDTVYNSLMAVLVVGLVWCLIAVVLAILTLRRSNIARILLIISAAVTALVSLLLILTIVSAVTLICGVSVAVMLLGGRSRDWFERKDAAPPMPIGTTQPWG